MRMAMLAALALALTISGSSAGPAVDQAEAGWSGPVAWVELTGAGQQIRAVGDHGSCPHAQIDGQAVRMTQRALLDPAFPQPVCQAPVPPGARSASVDGHVLPLLTVPPRRILVLGDTGCRLKGDLVQDCSNTASWPFPEVARRAAAMKPDLVIHVGDYYYRETACPPGRAACAGSPHGDNWPTWRADFFDPARPLLQAAPFVFARGNHESCARGGEGWTRLLDVADTGGTCPWTDAGFKIDLGGLNLYVLDSADADDRFPSAVGIGRITQQLDALGADLAHVPGWILTHRPVWAVTPVARLGPIGPAEIGLNKTLQAAMRGRDLSAVSMIVSGHVHHFAAYDFGPGRPAQLVAGTGGDVQEESDLSRIRTSQIGIDGLAAQRLTFARFGYLMLERDPAGDGWSGLFRDLNDQPVAACRLQGRELTCRPA